MIAHLLLGPAGTGKTRACLAALRACERAGEAAILIVPDQFTYAADRLLLEDPSLAGTRFVRVLSFRRLTRWIAQSGHGGGTVISEEGQRLVLQQILLTLPAGELGPLDAVRHMPGLVVALARTLREMKGTAGRALAAELAAAVADTRKTGAGAASTSDEKLSAFAQIVNAYDNTLAEAALIDRGDWIHDLAAELRRAPGPWAQRRLWIDGFMSFTPEERALLPTLAEVAREVTITLCADPGDAQRILDQAREAAPHGVGPLSVLFAQRAREAIRRPQFLPTLRTALWLQERMPALKLKTLAPPPHRFGQAPELTQLEGHLFASVERGSGRLTGAGIRSGSDPGTWRPGISSADASPANAPAVQLRPCATPYHEVVTWARWIDARARLGGRARYREHAVMVRDLDAYRPLVREVFAHYGIPIFLDERRDAAAHPRVRLCLTTLHLAASGWTRELVMELLRNPLLGVPADVADRIENLSLEYGIDYERWLTTDWHVSWLPPRTSARGSPSEREAGGIEDEGQSSTADEPADEEGADADAAGQAAMERRRQAADEARAVTQRLFPSVRAFTEAWQGGELRFADAHSLLGKLLGELLPDGKLDETQNETSDRALPGAQELAPDGTPDDAQAAPAIEGWTADETARVEALLEETLDLGNRLLGTTPVSASLCARLLREGLATASIGVAPQKLDAVTIADPRRSRVNEARSVVVGGLTARAFPRTVEEDPLFTDEERRVIADRSFPIGAYGAPRAEEDPYLFYIACTRASEELLLTYARLDASGASQEPSPYLTEVALCLGWERHAPAEPASDPRSGPFAQCQNACEIEPALARAFAGLDAAAAERVSGAVRSELADVSESGNASLRAQQYIDHARDPLPMRLPPELAERLYPERTLITSASRLETFGTCPYRYFAHHVLRLEPRPEAVLTPLSTGSAVHAALERFFAHARPGETDDQAARRLHVIFAELAQEEEFRIFQEDPPSAYRWSATVREVGLFMRTEGRRLGKSTFEPRAVEMSFGLGDARDEDADSARLEHVRRQLLEDSCHTGLRIPALELTLPAAGLHAGEDRDDGRIILRGRIDRLDLHQPEVGQPCALIIDYKRGARSRAPSSGLSRGLDLQVATYLLAVREVLGILPVAGFYYGVSPRPRVEPVAADQANPLEFTLQGFYMRSMASVIDPEEKILKPKAAGGHDAGLDGVLATARERIFAHSRRILAGEIRPAPVALAGRLPCEMCDYGGVCRFDPTYAPPVEAETEEGDAS